MKTTNCIGIASLLVTIFAAAGDARAEVLPQQACAAARINAAGKYTACQAKALAKFEASYDYEALRASSSKCQTKYAAVWPKLQSKFAGTGTPCDQLRYIDNATTVSDNLTGLQWEKKTDDNTLHDRDNAYAYTSAGDLDESNADGNAFDDFIFNVAGSCFANNCDWRLPTREELQTIMAEAYPCTTSPCIAATFGPTSAGFHVTASKVTSDVLGEGLLVVSFADGGVTQFATSAVLPARAVRGGF